MAFKKYAYYNKGNKFSIVESEMCGGSGNLSVAHCTLGGYSTKDTCEAAGGQWIPSSSASSSGIWEKYISPKESVADGIEIESSYAPTFNLQSVGREGSDLHQFIAWGSNGTNLLLFTYGASAVADLSSLFAADDWIYISGSGRWTGLHQVLSTGGATGILTLKTKCNLRSSALLLMDASLNGTTEVISGNGAPSLLDFQNFIDNLEDLGGRSYYFVSGAADAENNGIFSPKTVSTNGSLGVVNKITLNASSGDYTETASDLQTVTITDDSLNIHQVFYEQLSVYENVEVLQDESFELDLSDYQAQAVVYYVKAKIAEDLRDVEGREYFMRLFRKQIEKASSSRKRGPYMIQGFSGMRNY